MSYYSKFGKQIFTQRDSKELMRINKVLDKIIIDDKKIVCEYPNCGKDLKHLANCNLVQGLTG